MQVQVLVQPPKSKLCGHTCVAMVANTTVEDAIKLIGHTKGTKTKAIAKALWHLGFTCPDRLITIRKNGIPADIAICKLVRERRMRGNWHWVLQVNGAFYDPDSGFLEDQGALEDTYPDWRLTSYLPIQKIVE